MYNIYILYQQIIGIPVRPGPVSFMAKFFLYYSENK